jgi:hypothetical protein
LDSIDPLLIKSYTPSQSVNLDLSQATSDHPTKSSKTAALCSANATYKLKKSETSNTFLITGLTSGQIYK